MNYYADELMFPFYYRGHQLIVIIYAIILYICTSFYGGYRIGHHKTSSVIYSGIFALIITNVITYFQTSLINIGLLDVRPIAAMTGIQIGLIIILAFLAGRLHTRLYTSAKLLMVSYKHLDKQSDQAMRITLKLAAYNKSYKIQEEIELKPGETDKITAEITNKQYNNVILCDLPAEDRNNLLKFCYERGINTYTTPKITDILLRSASDPGLFDTPLLHVSSSGLTYEQRFTKRIFDIIVSSLVLLLAGPFMLLIAGIIKLYDGGPVFYKQERLTKGRRIFTIFKFRSMIVEAEKNGAELSTVDDSRITGIGKVLRMCRLDELPQLFNILRGDMSIVGPRPERPEIAVEYETKMPEFKFRLGVKAGLTGLAQTTGRYNTTPYDKLRLDLMYITGYSLLRDISIMLMTAKILLDKNSTK